MDPNVIVAALPEILTQIFGFVAVFFILKKYAFASIFQILDERQKIIALSIEEAEQRKLEMESLKKDYEQRLQEIEQEGRTKIQMAIAEGDRIASEIREKARQDAVDQLAHAKHEIQRETENARALVRQEVVDLSVLMAGRLIEKNLSDAENEKYVLDLLSNVGEFS